MAFNQRMVIEVDVATGNNGNGGGFDDTTGVPGTNYAWGAGQTTIAYTDAVIGGTTTQATSVARPFIAADVGNIINWTAAGGWTGGRYQILSVAAGVATFDRSLGTGASTGGTGTLGGSLATIQKGIDAAFINAGAIADCRVYVKKGAYTGTVALLTTGSVAASKTACRIFGYNTAHDDFPTIQSGNQPSRATGSGAGVNGFDISTSSGFYLASLTFDGAVTSGTASVKGINVSLTNSTTFGCRIVNFTAEGWIASTLQTGLAFSEITACAGTTASVSSSTGLNMSYCWVHKNTKGGISAGIASTLVGNLVTNNSGASSDGLTITQDNVIAGNLVYGSGRDGLRIATSQVARTGPLWLNNIFAKSVGVGMNSTTAGAPPLVFLGIDYNAFYSNGSDYANITAGAHDVAIATNPFVSSDADLAAETTPNWGLNSIASAGASLRAAGFPGVMPNLSTSTGYRDIGLFQHQDSGGGTFIQPPRGLSGGLWRA